MGKVIKVKPDQINPPKPDKGGKGLQEGVSKPIPKPVKPEKSS